MSNKKQTECCCSEKERCSRAASVQNDKIDMIISPWKGRPGALIPVLQETQRVFGYLSSSTLHHIADLLGESYSKVHGVVTFYSFFSLVPRGKYLIRVCLGTACYVRGAEGVLTALKQQLGLEVGQTTSDKVFTLETGRCFGACGLAPVIMVNDDVHQQVASADVEKIIRAYRKKYSESAEGAL